MGLRPEGRSMLADAQGRGVGSVGSNGGESTSWAASDRCGSPLTPRRETASTRIDRDGVPHPVSWTLARMENDPSSELLPFNRPDVLDLSSVTIDAQDFLDEEAAVF